jgi:hypothetical protein
MGAGKLTLNLRAFLLILVLLLSATLPMSSYLCSSEDVFSTSGRDDDFCEDPYTTETSCNTDSQCHWGAETDSSDSDLTDGVKGS